MKNGVNIKQDVEIGVNEGFRLTVRGQYGDPVTYEIVQPGFAQDDGMSGNIVIRCVAQGWEQKPDTLSYVGLSTEHGDFGFAMEDDDSAYAGETEEEVMGRSGVNFVRIAPTTF